MTSAALSQLPAVGIILQEPRVQEWITQWGHDVLVRETRVVLDQLRARLREPETGSQASQSREQLLAQVLVRLEGRLTDRSSSELGPVLNATGIVLHTSLGRAALSDRARDAVLACSRN